MYIMYIQVYISTMNFPYFQGHAKPSAVYTMRFLQLVVTASCLLTSVSVLYLITNESTEYSISNNIQLPGTLCLNSEINSSNETPEKYFLPLTAVTNLNHKKFLIYQCTSLWCGGLGDRFRGITNSFLLALITGRTFGIQHTVPCLLQKFLKPHRYQWIIDDQILKNAKSSETYDLIDKQSLPSANMTAYLKEDVVYLKINGDITLNLMDQADAPSRTPWLTKFSVSDLFESVLSHLFVMTDDLQRDMTKFRQEHVGSNKTVCVQYRAGKNPTIPNDGPRHGNKYLNRVWDFLSKYNKTGHVIYIATDSEHVKNEGKSKFPGQIYWYPWENYSCRSIGGRQRVQWLPQSHHGAPSSCRSVTSFFSAEVATEERQHSWGRPQKRCFVYEEEA